MSGLFKRIFNRVGRRQRSRAGGRSSLGLEAQEPFDRLVAGVRDQAIALLDPKGRVLTWNAGAEQLNGYRAEDIIGRPISRLYTHESLRRGWPQSELEVARTSGRFEEEGWKVRKDGTRFWASIVVDPIRDDR